MKSWLSKFLRKESGTDPSQVVRLRTVRFRHLLRHYGQMVALCVDAAEKQSGEYILDKAYVLSLTDKAFETVQDMIYDLNVLAGQRYAGLYDSADSIRQKATTLFKEESAFSAAPGEEEPEYLLLRKIRKVLFGRESVARPDDDASRTSLFGIAESAMKSASDSMSSLMQPFTTLPSIEKAHGGAPPPIKTSVMDLMKGLKESEGSSLVSDPFSADSAAARAFLKAFFSSEFWEGPSAGTADSNSALVACGLEDSMSAVLFHGEEYDLFDAFVSGAPEANHVYCRFQSGERGPAVSAILERLGFSISGIGGELTGWISSQPLSEMVSRVQAVAELAVFLLQPCPAGPSWKAEDEVNRFFHKTA